MIRDLFEEGVRDVRLAPGAMLLGGFARRFEAPGVVPLEAGHHALMGGHRINLTFRRAA
jgi:alkylated DNA repair protein (DNA oxidative demethylase)